jgi:hypothetical protein
MSCGRVILVALLALSLTPSKALGTAQDVASTHAYIRAGYALARASDARWGTVQGNIERFERGIGQQCRDVGTGSPETEAAQPLGVEVVGALWSVGYGTDVGPIEAFARAVRSLRFSDRKLARLAQAYARSLHELATLAPPDLCGDVRAWSSSGFRVVPAATSAFDRRVEAIEPRPVPARLLARYERAEDRGMLKSIAREEATLESFEIVHGQNDWYALLEILAVKP